MSPLSYRAFAPATVSNVACGFDCLGFAIEGPGDEVVAEARQEPGIEIIEQTGDGGRLPMAAQRNTAGVAVRALVEETGMEGRGINLRVYKRMPLSSGLGSSAASAVAAARAAAALLGVEAEEDLILRCALEGERMACGSAHPDNAAPSTYGGLVLIRSIQPLDVIELPVPAGLTCALVRPHVGVDTRDARTALGETLPLATAVRQWANLGALVAGLHRGDMDMISRCLIDVVAEPRREHLVPGFRAIKKAARDAGALGCSLSGSGPTIFALCTTAGSAKVVADAMSAAAESAGVACDRLVSPVGTPGVRLLEPR